MRNLRDFFMTARSAGIEVSFFHIATRQGIARLKQKQLTASLRKILPGRMMGGDFLEAGKSFAVCAMGCTFAMRKENALVSRGMDKKKRPVRIALV